MSRKNDKINRSPCFAEQGDFLTQKIPEKNLRQNVEKFIDREKDM